MSSITMSLAGRLSFEVGAIQQIVSVTPSAAVWRTVGGQTITSTGSGLSQANNRVVGQIDALTIAGAQGDQLDVRAIDVPASALQAGFATDIFTRASDVVSGSGGADTIAGGGGTDSLVGGGGNDLLLGGTITDSLPGMSVKRLYWTAFGRQPDEPGWASWVKAMDEGRLEIGGVAEGFLLAPEARFQANSSNADFVKGLYGGALGRNAADAEIKGWVDLLDGGARRAEVLLGVAESLESRSRLDTAGHVEYAYRAMRGFLGREPDAAGFQGWIDYLERFGNRSLMATSLAFSQEFIAKNGNIGDREAFVTMLYRVVLEREPDAARLAYWTDFRTGGQREDIAASFANSAELAAKSKAGMLAAMPALLAPHNDTLKGGAGDDTLDGGLGADTLQFERGGGHDTVLRFDAWDRVQLQGFGYASKADALAHLSQQGFDVIFADQGQSITFANVQLGVVQQAEWLLS